LRAPTAGNYPGFWWCDYVARTRVTYRAIAAGSSVGHRIAVLVAGQHVSGGKRSRGIRCGRRWPVTSRRGTCAGRPGRSWMRRSLATAGLRAAAAGSAAWRHACCLVSPAAADALRSAAARPAAGPSQIRRGRHLGAAASPASAPMSCTGNSAGSALSESASSPASRWKRALRPRRTSDGGKAVVVGGPARQ
jgi:hypothetical protein